MLPDTQMSNIWLFMIIIMLSSLLGLNNLTLNGCIQSSQWQAELVSLATSLEQASLSHYPYRKHPFVLSIPAHTPTIPIPCHTPTIPYQITPAHCNNMMASSYSCNMLFHHFRHWPSPGPYASDPGHTSLCKSWLLIMEEGTQMTEKSKSGLCSRARVEL